MEDLGHQCSDAMTSSDINVLPELTQYSIRLPFRVAVVGQTDSVFVVTI